MRHWCRRCRTLLSPYKSFLTRHTQWKLVNTCFASAATVFVHCQAKQNLELQAAEVSKLSQENLLKSSADQNVEAVQLLLTQVTEVLLQAEEKYTQAVEQLKRLVEHHQEVVVSGEEEEEVWDAIVQARHRVHVCHSKVEELQLLFTFVRKLSEASAEVALLAGSDVNSRRLEDQVCDAQQQLQAARQHRVHMQRQLQQVEAHSVQVMAEQAQREERERKKEA
ncbi:diablo IAP-binding mitochondrial protein-like [Babylonia areolata]|uniref:diablo IAP-binding mitochondrial protein-like n=1 Tax=Babylonia areolata TaxID=304850 RepID=UPI003FD321C0